jgi:pyruvate/2-oxoglutarate dehydrogenase complex dihydrolipoamide dehydrogenase (E3) component
MHRLRLVTAFQRWGAVDEFDFVIIGAGAAGEAAANMARERGASVAIVDRDLFGGSCPFWACIPSKSLLHSADVYAKSGDYPWPRASDRRDYMINRVAIPYPDDKSHAMRLERAGAIVIRGEARIIGSNRVEVRSNGATQELAARNIIVAVGSGSKIPPVEGLEAGRYWTNREATSTRELPRSLVILGGGPTGVELTQVYARYGVPTTIVDSNPRLLAREHPRSSEAIQRALGDEGVRIRVGVRAQRLEPSADDAAPHSITLSDGTTIEGHEILVAVGRTAPLSELGLENVGVDANGRDRLDPDELLRVAPNIFVIGDVAGPELHTHLAHYQGELAVRIALGEKVRPDYRAIPRATYTDPEVASVGLQLEQARELGHDAFEETADLGTSAKGYVAEASGHVTIVVDGREKALLGAFIAGPGASEAIHEAVLAVKTRVPMGVLADTIHAFPTTARVLGGLFGAAARKLGQW